MRNNLISDNHTCVNTCSHTYSELTHTYIDGEKVNLKNPPAPPNFNVGRGKAHLEATDVKKNNIEVWGAG